MKGTYGQLQQAKNGAIDTISTNTTVTLLQDHLKSLLTVNSKSQDIEVTNQHRTKSWVIQIYSRHSLQLPQRDAAKGAA